MSWLAAAKHWQIFLFLISGFWLQLIFEFAEIFSDTVPEMSSLAFSMITLGLTLVWIRAIGVAAMTAGQSTLQPLFTLLCWISAACFLYFGYLSIMAEDPEIFLQPSYLRPMFFVALALFMFCFTTVHILERKIDDDY